MFAAKLFTFYSIDIVFLFIRVVYRATHRAVFCKKKFGQKGIVISYAISQASFASSLISTWVIFRPLFNCACPKILYVYLLVLYKIASNPARCGLRYIHLMARFCKTPCRVASLSSLYPAHFARHPGICNLQCV